MSIVKLIAKQTFVSAFTNKGTLAFAVLLGAALLMATYIGWQHYKTQNNYRLHYKQMVRERWLASPDKHPHRMAHYGYLAFREKHELSFFDFGIESFAGVSVFLEAHKQNSVNFSEAGFSNGMLRFGEISVAMVLQLLVPLLLFFLGHAAISGERESGTLSILLCQDVTWRQLLWGKALGIYAVGMALFLPLIGVTVFLWASLSNWSMGFDSALRLMLLMACYAVYFLIITIISILVSAFNKSSKSSLIVLLSCWIFFIVIMPRITQAIGVKAYPAPSKMEFADAIAADVHLQGDSHDPNDPHYAAIKDSLLSKYKVSNVNQLPFNYGGYIMAEGERITSGIYAEHQRRLNQTLTMQNKFSTLAGYINPYLSLKHISMALSSADFHTYIDFQHQAESYRYALAQKMNRLQRDKISNIKPGPNDKALAISSSNWASQPDFNYHFPSLSNVLSQQLLGFGSLAMWLLLAILLLQVSARWIKTI